MKVLLTAALLMMLFVVVAFHHDAVSLANTQRVPASGKAKVIIDDAIDQTNRTLHYDPAYVRIGYPGGDVPMDRGVCSDVVVRAFRKAGIDLQKDIHEDML